MPGFDDRLTRELERVARPEPAELDLIREVDRRRGRRAVVRKAQAAGLAIVVLLGTGGGVVALNRVFRSGASVPGTSETPAIPTPTNGVIVFSRPVNGGDHLFSINPDGTGEHQLTPDGQASYLDPSISPDGSTIAVAHRIPSFDSDESVIATIPIEGGPPTWLTEPGLYLDPAWSPDGKKIAFVGTDGGVYGIHVMNADGSDPFLVPGTDDTEVAGPAWSPDGSRIAFATPNDDEWDIETVSLDGSDFRLVTSTNDASESWPTWSWATDRIAFARSGPTDGIFTINPDGSEEQQLTDTINPQPAWSPDGQFLVFFENRIPGPSGLFTIRADGRDAQRITTGGDFSPAWQPVPESGPSPEPSVEPSQPSAKEIGRDIGLDFNVCFPDWLGGIDFTGNGTQGSAWTGVPVADDGTCPRYPRSGNYVLAVDYTGDRLADSWLDVPFDCEVGCAPYDATDLDGNGSEELVVNSFFSIMDFHFFWVRQEPGGDPQLEPILTAEPGHEPADITGGLPLRIDAGGDAGYGSSIQCEGYPSAPILVWSWSYGPVETDIPKEVHVTRIQLQADGLFHVIGTNDYMVPAREPTGIGYETDPACGVDWHPAP